MNIFWNSQVRNLGVERTEAKVTVEIATAATVENDMETEAPTWCNEETDSQNSLTFIPWCSESFALCLGLLDCLMDQPWQIRSLNLGNSGYCIQPVYSFALLLSGTSP